MMHTPASRSSAAVRLIPATCLLFAALILSCQSTPDESTGPPPVDPVKHYKLYSVSSSFFARGLAVHDIPADTLLRQLVLNDPYDLLALTPSYNHVLVSAFAFDTTLLIDADSLIIRDTLAFGGRYHVDQQRARLILVGASGLFRINPTTFAKEDSLPYIFRYTQLDTLGGRLYGVGDPPLQSSIVYRIDYETMQLVDSFVVRNQTAQLVSVTDLLPVASANRLYLYGIVGSASSAFVWNLSSGQVVSSVAHDFPVGSFLKLRDNQTVIKADPGPLTSPGSGRLWRYTIATDAITGSYSTVVNDNGTPITLNATSAIQTPDGMYLYVAAGTPGRILRLDLSTGVITNFFDPLSSFFPPEIALGPEIN